MTGCRSHGDLIGPYVLGGARARRARGDEGAPGRVRPLRSGAAAAGDAARAARQRAGRGHHRRRCRRSSRTRCSTASSGSGRRPRGRARRWPRFAIPAAAAATRAARGRARARTSRRRQRRAYARAELWSTSGEVLGSASVAEVDSGTHVKLRATHLPVCQRRWSTSSGACAPTAAGSSGGSFHARADGSAAAELTAAVRPGDYHVVVVTRRSVGGERGAEVMRGKLTY